MLRRLLLTPALAAGVLAPGGVASGAEVGAVEVTAAVQSADGGLTFDTERAPSRAHGLELARQMRSRPRVVAAAVATRVHAFEADPLRARQWALTRLAAEQTWQQGPAQGRLVAVIDTGVDASHPDLAPVTVPGLDLVGGSNGQVDPHGHGTHVAGVVAAVAGNGVGGAGLAQGARILPVRALEANGSGYDSDVAEGVVWAVDNGAKVVNLSLGGEVPSSLLTAAIQYALRRGVSVVAAAGNAGASGDPVLYPGATPGVIAVGAVDADDVRPAWSSSGSHLALTGPGVGILSTLPGGDYGTWDGTSMAAPFVAAAVALLSADDPSLSPADLRSRLMATARDLGPAGHDRYTGAGMLDVVAARRVGLGGPAPAPPPVVLEPAVSEPGATAPAPISAPVSAPIRGPAETSPVVVPAPVAAPAVSVTPGVISAGQRVTVTYRGTPGAVVDVLSRTQPATSFSRIGSVTLDGTGTASSSHAPQKNTRITARSASGQVSATQPIVAVRSVASLAVQRVGTRTYAFTGRVYPALYQRLVNVYRNGVLVAQARCRADGTYAVTRTLAAGTFTFQARTPNDTSNLGTSSPARLVRVS